MISRRDIVSAGVLGTLAVGGVPEEAAAQNQDQVQALRAGLRALEDQMKALKTAVDGLRGNSMDTGGVAVVKARIQDYAKASGRFPDYCDIGLAVFYDVYDWHARNQQQITIARLAEQRLSIQFMLTQLVLRWENDVNYVGAPYSL